MTADNAATACRWHMPVPSTSATARSARGTDRHGAHQPSGDMGGGTAVVTPSSSRARHPDHMPWSNSSRRSSRYGREHRAARAAHMAALRRAGSGVCAERVCVKRSRTIYPTDDLHLCHDPTGTRVIGLGHADCNRHEAAVRARRLQTQRRTPRRRTTRQSQLKW